MKKLVLIITLLSSLPVFAACSIENSDTACSIAQFHQEEMQPTFTRDNSNLKEFSGTPETRLKPAQNTADKNFRKFGPQSVDYSYNSSCQFGVCSNTGTPQLFQMRNRNE